MLKFVGTNEKRSEYNNKWSFNELDAVFERLKTSGSIGVDVEGEYPLVSIILYLV